MKKIKFLLLMATMLSTAWLSSCMQEGEIVTERENKQGNVKVSVVFSEEDENGNLIPITRATSSEKGWTEGFGLYHAGQVHSIMAHANEGFELKRFYCLEDGFEGIVDQKGEHALAKRETPDYDIVYQAVVIRRKPVEVIVRYSEDVLEGERVLLKDVLELNNSDIADFNYLSEYAVEYYIGKAGEIQIPENNPNGGYNNYLKSGEDDQWRVFYKPHHSIRESSYPVRRKNLVVRLKDTNGRGTPVVSINDWYLCDPSKNYEEDLFSIETLTSRFTPTKVTELEDKWVHEYNLVISFE